MQSTFKERRDGHSAQTAHPVPGRDSCCHSLIWPWFRPTCCLWIGCRDRKMSTAGGRSRLLLQCIFSVKPQLKAHVAKFIQVL